MSDSQKYPKPGRLKYKQLSGIQTFPDFRHLLYVQSRNLLCIVNSNFQFFNFLGGENTLGGLSQAIRGTAQLMEQGVGTMSKFQGMLPGK